jgi:hypothetical protein
MPSIKTQRATVLAEAVVSAYINELSTRERPAQPLRRERGAAPRARVPRRDHARPRRRPALAEA